MTEPIINKVSESGLITIDPVDFLPQEKMDSFDLKDHLFHGLILKEKDFRDTLKNYDWKKFQDKTVAVFCSADAIIPVWAYMLVASHLQPVAAEIIMGDINEVSRQLTIKNLEALDLVKFKDQRIVIKGCGDTPVGDFVYMELTKRLRPVVKSIMYGEPCSTVPVFKRAAS